MRADIRAAWPHLRARWRYAFLMGTFGYSVFSVLLYLSGHFTTAINIALVQGAIPIFTILGAYLVYRAPIRAVQIVGILLTMIGVAVVASGGSLAKLAALTLNAGDMLIVTACAFYAGYTVALRERPPVSGFALYAALAAGAALSSIPMLGVEIALGKAVFPDVAGLAILAFVAIGPSFLAQVFYMRAVELIGAGRAVLFANLTPVIGAIFAVAILGEPFGWHHALALVLVLGGIAIAERGRGG
jgi:drug/metabolite transporter (DMT)-like permease